jgi:hypothetical protein
MNETSSDDDNFITENQIEKQSLNFFLQSNQNEESQEHENNIKLKENVNFIYKVRTYLEFLPVITSTPPRDFNNFIPIL